VHEKDLGPDTAKLAERFGRKDWKATGGVMFSERRLIFSRGATSRRTCARRGVLQLPSLAVEWYGPTLSDSSRSIVIGVSEFPHGTRSGKRKWEIVT
jgi:hypothetical protein